MSTLEKTIHLLNVLPESQIETSPASEESLEDIFGKIVGSVPDMGKTLEMYQEERLRERYEAFG